MPDDPRVQRLLDELLESGGSPEQLCAGCPELLPKVRTRWRQIRRLTSDLDSFFPPSGGRQEQAEPELPVVPGYQVESVLGRGGMGIVFRARHLRLKRPVALKMLLSGSYAVREELDRFVQESEAIAALRHPNIVQVYDAGEVDSRPYFTMELVDCGRLSEKGNGVPQPAREAAALVAAIAGAVHAAHQNGIVHRDLKPSNVLLCADGTPKVTDFGLARRMEGDRGATLTGLPMGTPSYMAPEQARGEKGSVGPAADVYSLGAILYDLLTGRPPFRAETTTATLQQVLTSDVVPPRRLNPCVPRDLETICLKCLEKEPVRRYGSAAALASDLGRFRRGEPITARPVGRIARALKWARRRPAVATALVTGALTAVTLLGVAVWIVTGRAATARAVNGDLDEAVRQQESGAWPQASAALERARLRLGSRGPNDLRGRFEHVRRDAELVARLEAIRMSHAYNKVNVLAFGDADTAYDAAFRQLGFAAGATSVGEVGDRIRQSHVRRALVKALYDWSVCAADGGRIRWLREVAQAADPDPTGWRARALGRDPAQGQAAVAALASDPAIDAQPVSLVLLAATAAARDHLDPMPLLLRAQRAHPDDFWVNLALGDEMWRVENYPEAIRYYQVVLAMRPDSPVGHFSLGVALAAANRPREAIDEYHEALRVGGDSPVVRVNLAAALSMTGQHEEACREFERAALKQVP